MAHGMSCRGCVAGFGELREHLGELHHQTCADLPVPLYKMLVCTAKTMLGQGIQWRECSSNPYSCWSCEKALSSCQQHGWIWETGPDAGFFGLNNLGQSLVFAGMVIDAGCEPLCQFSVAIGGKTKPWQRWHSRASSVLLAWRLNVKWVKAEEWWGRSCAYKERRRSQKADASQSENTNAQVIKTKRLNIT